MATLRDEMEAGQGPTKNTLEREIRIQIELVQLIEEEKAATAAKIEDALVAMLGPLYTAIEQSVEIDLMAWRRSDERYEEVSRRLAKLEGAKQGGCGND